MKRRYVPAVAVSVMVLSGGVCRADDWGCQVLLCLANPGGATQYAECVPPVTRLWDELRKGHAFPTCSGVGYSASRPVYQPYSCPSGHVLGTRARTDGQPDEIGCIAVDAARCPTDGLDVDYSTAWTVADGRTVCTAHPVPPTLNPQPNYIDVTIDGRGTQRVWF